MLDFQSNLRGLSGGASAGIGIAIEKEIIDQAGIGAIPSIAGALGTGAYNLEHPNPKDKYTIGDLINDLQKADMWLTNKLGGGDAIDETRMARVDKRTEKEKRIDVISAWVFILYMAISGFFMVKIETEFNASFFFAFKYLTLPIFIVIPILGMKYKHLFQRAESMVFYIVGVFFIIPVVTVLMSAGYVSFFNAIFPPQETVYYKGIIKEKFISGASRKSYVITLDIDDDKRRFTVSEEEYNKIKLGQLYKVKMKKGGLGIVYKINP